MERDMFHINYRLISAVREGNLERTEELINSFGLSYSPGWSEGYCLLCEALKNKQAAVAKLLLTYDCKVKSKNINPSHTPLHLAVENGDIEIVVMILNKGAIIDAKNKNGCTPLYYAIRLKKMEITELLLKYGANVNHTSIDGKSLLHIAIEIGFLQIVEHLLNYSAWVNCVCNLRWNKGYTPLHFAVERGSSRLKVVTTLLEYGSDINITCKSSTPRDYAKTGIILCHNKYNNYADYEDYEDYDDYDYYDSDDDGYSFFRCGNCPCEEIDKALEHHIVKMKTANLYVSQKNLLSVRDSYKIRDFQKECEKEIASMKSEKINNSNISFYDVLTKGINSLEICMRNENMMQILKSDIYKTKFPMYASMIENHLRKGMERKELLKQGNTIFYLFFNNFLGLPHDCTEKIFSYLSNEDLRILMDACKPPSISYPDTNY